MLLFLCFRDIGSCCCLYALLLENPHIFPTRWRDDSRALIKHIIGITHLSSVSQEIQALKRFQEKSVYILYWTMKSYEANKVIQTNNDYKLKSHHFREELWNKFWPLSLNIQWKGVTLSNKKKFYNSIHPYASEFFNQDFWSELSSQHASCVWVDMWVKIYFKWEVSKS